jgi:hypothetical protein
VLGRPQGIQQQQTSKHNSTSDVPVEPWLQQELRPTLAEHTAAAPAGQQQHAASNAGSPAAWSTSHQTPQGYGAWPVTEAGTPPPAGTSAGLASNAGRHAAGVTTTSGFAASPAAACVSAAQAAGSKLPPWLCADRLQQLQQHQQEQVMQGALQPQQQEQEVTDTAVQTAETAGTAGKSVVSEIKATAAAFKASGSADCSKLP